MEQGEALRMRSGVPFSPRPLPSCLAGKGSVHRRRPGGCQGLHPDFQSRIFLAVCHICSGWGHWGELPEERPYSCVSHITSFESFPPLHSVGARSVPRRKQGAEDVWLPGQEEHPSHHSELPWRCGLACGCGNRMSLGALWSHPPL